jgi:hypothetical protein
MSRLAYSRFRGYLGRERAPRYDHLEEWSMNGNHLSNREIVIKPDDFDLLHEALLFAREEFTDVNCLRWSNGEYRRLQEIIGEIETRMERESTDSA